jgi:hypothetical protein
MIERWRAVATCGWLVIIINYVCASSTQDNTIFNNGTEVFIRASDRFAKVKKHSYITREGGVIYINTLGSLNTTINYIGRWSIELHGKRYYGDKDKYVDTEIYNTESIGESVMRTIIPKTSSVYRDIAKLLYKNKIVIRDTRFSVEVSEGKKLWVKCGNGRMNTTSMHVPVEMYWYGVKTLDVAKLKRPVACGEEDIDGMGVYTEINGNKQVIGTLLSSQYMIAIKGTIYEKVDNPKIVYLP